jgi:hypothetical protein
LTCCGTSSEAFDVDKFSFFKIFGCPTGTSSASSGSAISTSSTGAGEVQELLPLQLPFWVLLPVSHRLLGRLFSRFLQLRLVLNSV